MSQITTTSSTGEIPTSVKVIAQPTPFYKTFSFWLILISVIIFIVIGFIIFFETSSVAGGFTLIGFYVFAIVLLIIGILIAAMG